MKDPRHHSITFLIALSSRLASMLSSSSLGISLVLSKIRRAAHEPFEIRGQGPQASL
ncbi:hypothetical protein RSAG8_07334, partial [Rhizoctonia solani AG-8 WAC10335]